MKVKLTPDTFRHIPDFQSSNKFFGIVFFGNARMKT